MTADMGVARMERSDIRGPMLPLAPDFAALNPGYAMMRSDDDR
jgi:hypothetical protein